MSYLQVQMSSLSQFLFSGRSVSDDKRKNIHQKKMMNCEKVSIQLLDLLAARKSSLLYFASMQKITKNVRQMNKNWIASALSKNPKSMAPFSSCSRLL